VSRPFTGPSAVLVTHQFNIRAVTGLSSVDSGEMVVLTPLGDAGFRVAGRLALPRGQEETR
jgi:hypothetical protein